MRNKINSLLSCLFLLLCVQSTRAVDLKTYREVYQKSSEEILQSFQPKFDDLQQQYQKALEALKANSVKQGDLTRTKAAIAEIDRFQKVKTLPRLAGRRRDTGNQDAPDGLREALRRF
jgi:hypothetical protein